MGAKISIHSSLFTGKSDSSPLNCWRALNDGNLVKRQVSAAASAPLAGEVTGGRRGVMFEVIIIQPLTRIRKFRLSAQ